jgi:hypothetical protein
LPARKFASFQEAAIEAGISRFYGGIHFMDAIDNGRKQGLLVGEWVLRRVENKAPAFASVVKKYLLISVSLNRENDLSGT